MRGALAVAVAVVVLSGWTAAWAAEPVLVIEGRGWGHGVGMSQEGARTMAAGGASTEEILAKFYPGTLQGSAPGTVRVLVLESGPQTEVLGFPEGGELRATLSGNQPPGFPIAVAPGGSARIRREDGGFGVMPQDGRVAGPAAVRLSMRLISAQGSGSTIATLPRSTTTSSPVATTTTTSAVASAASTSTTASSTTSTTATPIPAVPAPTTASPPVPTTSSPPAPPATGAALPSGTLWAVPHGDGTTTVATRGRQYRGTMEVGTDAGGGLRLVNHVDVESYLRGMGEVLDPTWAPAALRAQAIAARTYALRATGADYDLCDDDRCQVYLGQSAEYPAMDKAVADSRGQVLLFDGALATTFYSANGGGISATAEEGFGDGGTQYPYLRSAPYETANPDPWTQQAGLADVGRRFAYPGRLSSARVSSTGPSGRATQVTLDGDAGAALVDGPTFASRLGLKSTLFAVRSGVGDALPLPEVPATPAFGQVPGAPLPRADRQDLSPAAAETSVASQPWARQHALTLVLLLVTDMALMAFRAARRSQVGNAPALQPVA